MKQKKLKIKGMHCPSCNILVKDKFSQVKNITKIIADYKTQEAKIFYQGDISTEKLNQLIKPYGYMIVDEVKEDKNFLNNIFEFLAISTILFFGYLILKEFNLWPSFSYSNLSLPLVFILGLIASTSTCMATAGALYLSIAKSKNDWPTALSFNTGRVLSYFLFGVIFGFLGKTISTSVYLGGMLTLIIALLMIFLGLDMAGIFSWQKYFGLNTGRIFEFFDEKLKKYPRKMPFFLGLITYFLPCGFTQSVQVYVMSLANPWLSGVYMMVFAIGTVPLLMMINLALNIRQSNFYQYFLKIMGVLVFFVGASYIFNFLTLFNLNYFERIFSKNSLKIKNVEMLDGKQIIKMDVVSSGYQPNSFAVKKNVPVKWIVNGVNVLGCQEYFVVPSLGISQALKEGENIFEFTAKDDKPIYFSCGMGMYRGKIEVIN
ncbi:MAG: sulfite exporter TauE/SafE family protein [Microgenomates group bacterium]|nr:sulfite exporter TauE/SafE family protein [Microgenomates group bacterium]